MNVTYTSTGFLGWGSGSIQVESKVKQVGDWSPRTPLFQSKILIYRIDNLHYRPAYLDRILMSWKWLSTEYIRSNFEFFRQIITYFGFVSV